MPTYCQRCKKCGHRFEVQLPMARYSDPQPCPKCGAPTTVRVIAATTHVLKGGGWAKDGYQKGGNSDAN